MTLQQAYLAVSDKIPIDDIKVRQRLDRAYEIVRCDGEGYEVEYDTITGAYWIHKASTSLLEDSSKQYMVTTAVCTCPDFDKARGNLCKHRLAVMLVTEMNKG